MTSMWKFYFKMAAIAAVCLPVIGGFVPALVSSSDTMAVFMGLTLLITTPYAAYLLIKLFRVQRDAEAAIESAKAFSARYEKGVNVEKTAKKSDKKGRSNFRSIAPMFLLVMIAPLFGGCSYESVPAGNVLVVVNKYGSDKGVDVETRGPGRYWLTWNQEGHRFPTFVQSPKWTADMGDDYKDQGFTCSTRDGMVVGMDIGAQYEFVPDKIPVIFAKYRRGADELSDTVIRQLVADGLVTECSKISVEAAYGAGREELLNRVQEYVVSMLDPMGVRIITLNWLGKPRLPDEIEASITAKIAATQKAMTRENEVQEAVAQANKDRERARGEADAVKIRATAEAEANKLVSQSLTPELVKYRALDKWNGELPRINGAGAVPFVDVSVEAKKQ